MAPEGGLEELLEFDYEAELNEIKEPLSKVKLERPQLGSAKSMILDLVAGSGLAGAVNILNQKAFSTTEKKYSDAILFTCWATGCLASVLYRQNRQLSKYGICSWPVNVATAGATAVSYLLLREVANQHLAPGFAYDPLGIQFILLQITAVAGLAAYSAISMARAIFYPTTYKLLNHTIRAAFWHNLRKPEKEVYHLQKITNMPTAAALSTHLDIGDCYFAQGLINEAMDEYYFVMSAGNEALESKIPADILLKPFFSPGQKRKIKGNKGDELRNAVFSFRNAQFHDAAGYFTYAIGLNRKKPLPHIVYARFLDHCGLKEQAQREERFAMNLLPPIENIGERIEGSRNIVHAFGVRYETNPQADDRTRS